MIYLVCGHPRSGTSLMMRALERAGMDVVKWQGREEWQHRFKMGEFLANRDGLYEPPPPSTPQWPKQFDGKVVKVVTDLQRYLAVHEYRVIFMMRNPAAVALSYKTAFPSFREKPESLIRDIQKESRKQLENRKDVIDVQTVYYEHIMHYGFPRLDWPVELDDSIIDDGQYRSRA